jgi:hypothetical protein
MGKKGFTITEALLVPFILLLAVGSTMAIYITAMTMWKEASAQIVLQREGSIAMEKMVRGVSGINGIRGARANETTLTSSTNIEYTSNIDGIERRLYLNGNQIIYDPNTSTADDEYSIAENVRTSGLTFGRNNDIIRIELGLQDNVGDRVINVNLFTKVKLRN